MEPFLQRILAIAIVVFMVGNLFEVGLRLEVSEAFAALRNVRFVVLSLAWCFVLSPALAVLLGKIIGLSEPYALGLVFLGMAPCSPAIPMMVRRAGGSVAYMSAFMILAFVGTVVLMPFMVPLLARGFTANPWTIAKPLLFFIAAPMTVGLIIRRAAKPVAEKSAPIVKALTNVNTVLLVAVLVWLYGREMTGAIGTYAIASQVLFYALLGFGSYRLAIGLSYEEKVPMTLGVCTRNVGPAIAPLYAANAPRGAITMCVLAAFLGALLAGFVAAAILKRVAFGASPARSRRASR